MHGTADALSDSVRRSRLTALLAVLGFTGCSTLGGRGTGADEAPVVLTPIVAELKLHLRDDTYRFDRAIGADGRNVFSASLWKLDRLVALRGRAPSEWDSVDYTIEYARARALERLRRYDDARDAYARVLAAGSRLGSAALEPERRAARFAETVREPAGGFPTRADELAFLDSRIAIFRSWALEFSGTSLESLVLEETEAWEARRVDWYARAEESEAAIAACRRLIEGNRESKLYARHLIRLGDLYADSARRAQLNTRTSRSRFAERDYDALLEQAFSAYELAGEARVGSTKHEARTRIDALLAYHQGVRADAH